MSVTEVRCSNCQGALGVEDVNLSTGLARCRRCDKVFQLALGGSGMVGAKPAVPLPRGYSQWVDGMDLVIERRWFGFPTIMMLLFCSVWVFLSFEAAQAGLELLLLFPPFYVAVALSYVALCLLFNKTVIRVNPTRIEVKVGPVPAFGNRAVRAEQVDQLYCRKIVGSKGSVHYQLMVLLREGKAVSIGGYYPSREQVLYLEQQIERALGISDRFVEGEDRPGSDSPRTIHDLGDLVALFRKPKPPKA